MLKRSETVLEYQLPIKIEPQQKDGFLAVCPLWKDCYAQGDTLDEVVLEITAVAQSLIELYREEGLEIPLKLKQENKVANPLVIPVLVVG